MKRLQAVPFTRVSVEDDFWRPRMETNRIQTIPHAYRLLKETGRLDAFRLNWKPGQNPVPHIFWDSDTAKWVEAASCTLATSPDPALARLLDEVVTLVVSAQQPDGYLNTHFSTVEPDRRWSNLRDCHELYCAGHLIEAAVAHYQATGKTILLDAMRRYADYIGSVFGRDPGKKRGYCGHEEIELALVKLFRSTGERKYLDLASYFVNERGRMPSYFEMEAAERIARGWETTTGRTFPLEHYQAHLPVREQIEPVGHAVRATYLYAAMADLAIETHDWTLQDACERLWTNLCTTRMYLTGGIGSSRQNEGFTEPYDLPNEDAYCETCAAIGMVFWNHRMLHLTGAGQYADIMERALYNAVLSGVSIDGTKFFYVNPLESTGHHHRQDWFDCACCPPNIARLLASFGGYIYGEGPDTVAVHLYTASSVHVTSGGTSVLLKQETRYPWDGRVTIHISPQEPTNFRLALRIPGWCRSWVCTVNGMPMQRRTRHGYLTISRHWERGDSVSLIMEMPPILLRAHPSVRQDTGCAAVQRGPLVYCIEQVDHRSPIHRIVLPRRTAFTQHSCPSLPAGTTVLQTDALLVDDSGWDGMLYRPVAHRYRPFRATFVPYCFWDNRSPGAMRVWIPIREKE